MKKIMTITVLLINSFYIFAQVAQVGTPTTSIASESKFSWGLKGGINSAILHGGGDNSSLDPFFGYNAGIAFNIPLTKNFYLQTGLDFTNKGATMKYDAYHEMIIKLAYLQVPLLASYYANIRSNNFQWHFNVGPYFAYGILGSADWKESLHGETHRGSIDAFGDLEENSTSVGLSNVGLSRFDGGLSIATGFLISKVVYLGIQFDLGLLNMCGSRYPSDASFYSRTFCVRAGVFF